MLNPRIVESKVAVEFMLHSRQGSSPQAHHLSSLRYVMVGAAPVGRALEARWAAKAPGNEMAACTEARRWPHVQKLYERCPGVLLREGYGMTESTPMTIMTRAGRERPGSTGQLIPSTQVARSLGSTVGCPQARIVDLETGEDVALGGEGELLIRGPQVPAPGPLPPSLLQVMAGYLNNPEATALTVKDGWLHTGDIARYSPISLDGTGRPGWTMPATSTLWTG